VFVECFLLCTHHASSWPVWPWKPLADHLLFIFVIIVIITIIIIMIKLLDDQFVRESARLSVLVYMREREGVSVQECEQEGVKIRV
jgi:hypothetical protein